MKVGLIADIHANADALAAVLDAFRREEVERVLIAGDLVGYYYAADRVMDLLADWNCVAVRGNHEDMLLSWSMSQGCESISSRYGSGIDVALRCLSADNARQLMSLPASIELNVAGRSALLCHGSPWSVDEYLYADSPEVTRHRLFALGYDVVIFGHTHHPMLWQTNGQTAINPGSLGQPRDRKPGACWCLWNTDEATFELRREPYDTSALVFECRERDPHLPYLADVLTRQ